MLQSNAMSLQATNWALKQDVSPPTAKFVLTVLAHHAGPSGIAWPGQELIARECSVDVKTVQRHQAALVEQGFIAKVRRLRSHGSRTSDWIILGPEGDRSPMTDPDPDAFPSEVIERWGQPTPSSGSAARQKIKATGQNSTTLPDNSPSPPDKTGRLSDNHVRRTESTTEGKQLPEDLTREPATAASAPTREAEAIAEADTPGEYECLVRAVMRTEEFIDRRIEHGLGKAEYREADLNEWVGAFESLDTSDQDFTLALDEAFNELEHPSGRFRDWTERLQSKGAAAAFVAEFGRLLAKARERQELFSRT